MLRIPALSRPSRCLPRLGGVPLAVVNTQRRLGAGVGDAPLEFALAIEAAVPEVSVAVAEVREAGGKAGYCAETEHHHQEFSAHRRAPLSNLRSPTGPFRSCRPAACAAAGRASSERDRRC